MDNKGKFNLKHSGVKRIIQEIKELESQPSTEFIATALEEDMFEWHFVMRGPPDTDYEGGIYHGRILLPAEYPFKPPSFMMLTPSGRFQTNTKICLSISSHHPENWQPSWSVRTALTAMIAFMPTPGAGAVGSLDFPSEDKKALALRSRMEIPRFGTPERQQLINEMHQQMLDMEAQQDACPSPASPAPTTTDTPAAPATPGSPTAATTTTEPAAAAPATPTAAIDTGAISPPISRNPSDASTLQSARSLPAPATPQAIQPPSTRTSASSIRRTVSVPQQPTQTASDRGLTALAVALSVAIAAILLKKMVVFMMVQPAGFSS